MYGICIEYIYTLLESYMFFFFSIYICIIYNAYLVISEIVKSINYTLVLPSSYCPILHILPILYDNCKHQQRKGKTSFTIAAQLTRFSGSCLVRLARLGLLSLVFH